MGWNRSQAELLSVAAERTTEAAPPSDPLDAILAPFVPPAPQLDPVDALCDALRPVPSTAGAGFGATRTNDRPTACVGDWGSAADLLSTQQRPDSRLEQSEREAAMIRAGKAEQLHAPQQAEEHARRMRLNPSQRRRLREEEERAARFNQFPFTKLIDGSQALASATIHGGTAKPLNARF